MNCDHFSDSSEDNFMIENVISSLSNRLDINPKPHIAEEKDHHCEKLIFSIQKIQINQHTPSIVENIFTGKDEQFYSQDRAEEQTEKALPIARERHRVALQNAVNKLKTVIENQDSINIAVLNT